MGTGLKFRILAIGAFLCAVLLLSAAVWWASYVSALRQLEQQGQADLALAGDRLTGELQRYRELAVIMADHPVVTQIVEQKGTTETGQALLRRMADKTGSLDVLVLDEAGAEIAAASSLPPEHHAQTVYFERALHGALGIHHQVSARYQTPATPGRRAFIFAAPVFSAPGPVQGVVAVIVDVGQVEAEWRGDRPAIFFSDRAGEIFISNRDELLFLDRQAEGGFVPHSKRLIGGMDMWRLDGGRYLPARALHLERHLPVIDMNSEALLDVAPARQLALLQAFVAAAICLVLGAALFLATERRRTLAEANQRLEDAVARRTAELSNLNADLRREVSERSAAEEQLKKAQADLVQAGKLSALGQMSAGISHELNQPLMAIRTYAENAEAFLERDKPDVAGQNLNRISELAHRMGRIIRNLRAFAKQESESLTDVNLNKVIGSVLEMVERRAQDEAVQIDWNAPDPALWVRGGDVRLGQVVLNLVSNGMDAMQGQSDQRQISIQAERAGYRVMLSVRDTGPGLTEPDKIFDPFYSTKTVEQGGMGLGLSISYGLVQSFGGNIRGRNAKGGGAVVTIELDAVDHHEVPA